MTMPPFRPRDWSSHPAFIDKRNDGYKSTGLRGPTKPLIPIKQSLSELTGPVYGHDSVGELDWDLTKNGYKDNQPLGSVLSSLVVFLTKMTGRNQIRLSKSGRPTQLDATFTKPISTMPRSIRISSEVADA